MNDCQLLDFTAGIKEKAIAIRQHYNLKLPDAIIAASALPLQIPLISADGIFSRIDDLDFVHYVL